MWIDFGERGRTLARKANMFENQVSLVSSMTSKKSPNVYKSSPKMISLWSHCLLLGNPCYNEPRYTGKSVSFYYFLLGIKERDCKGLISKNGPSRPLFVYFRLFKQTIQFSNSHNWKKCPSGIWHMDLNPQHLEYESPPITTRPGLLPVKDLFSPH